MPAQQQFKAGIPPKECQQRVAYLATEIARTLDIHQDLYGHRKCPLKGKLHLNVRQTEVNAAIRILRKTMPRIRQERQFIVDPRG